MKTKKKLISIIIRTYLLIMMSSGLSVPAFSQGSAINTTGASADPSAMLDISSTNAGVLIPRMSEMQKLAILSPANGLLIYQTDGTYGFWYYDGSTWVQAIGPQGPAGVNGTTGATGPTGNSGLLPSGTSTGNTPYWNGSQWVVSSANIYNDGVSVGIGTSSPDASALIEMSSVNKGALIPRMSTAERDLIPMPAEGLQVYNITSKCLEIYIPPVWQKVYCGCNPPSAPSSSGHTASKTVIIWNWSSIAGADGYKFNTVDDYSSAIDNANNLSYTQSGLTCNTTYNAYIWSYSNTCGNSVSATLNMSTSSCSFSCGNSVTDARDGNIYNTVLIGTQCWLRDNMNVGVRVNGTAEQTNNSIIEKYCYDDNESNCLVYGGLYQWGEMVQYLNGASNTASWSPTPSGVVQGICPDGWHLPTDTEWCILENFLESNVDPACNMLGWRGSSLGYSLRESGVSHWTAPNAGATNNSGFKALPGGARLIGGSFSGIGNYSHWWLATDGGPLNAWNRHLHYTTSGVDRANHYWDKPAGFSVRCIMN